MGVCTSSDSSSKKGHTSSAPPPSKPPPKPKKNLNPADFVISGKTGESITRQDGSIDGEQFNVENCKNCDIFLLDNIAQSFIDECENCRFFIGPVESSVMVRNCKSCSIVMACQQFRSRDCSDIKLALLCTTEPIIETSINMQFACFDFFYFSLREQINRSGLKLWNNKWWMVYDFNKNPDPNNQNWSIMPLQMVPTLLDIRQCSGLTEEELGMDRVVPVTLGCRPRPSQESCLVIFLPDSDQYIEALIAKAAKTPTWDLVRTRAMPLADDRLKSLFAWSKEKGIVAQCKGRDIAAIELCGTGIHMAIQDAVQNSGLASGSKKIRIVPEDQTQMLAKYFFEVWKDEV